MIQIICDAFSIYPSAEKDLIIREDTEYEKGLELIAAADAESEELRVIVTNPAIFKWFDAPAKKYGCELKKIDPEELLKQALRKPIVPHCLKKRPDLIVELDALSKAKEYPIEKHETPDEWLIRVLIGNVWCKKKIESHQDIADLLSWLLAHQKKAFPVFCKELIDNQILLWHENSPGYSDLFAWLRENPLQRSLFLVWEKSLSKYPAKRVSEWLQTDGIWAVLSSLPDRHQYLPDNISCERLPNNIEFLIKAFLTDSWAESEINTLRYITCLLEVEKVFLSETLNKRLQDGKSIDDTILNAIKELKGCDHIIETAHQLLMPKMPSIPDVQASIDEIQFWLASEYLPFYHSCALLNQVDLTEHYISYFEDWLKRNYTSMLINGKGMAYRQIGSLKNEAQKRPILIVLFDGLDFYNAKNHLLPVLSKNGILPSSPVVPYFSFLPSETFIAKPTIASGKMKSQLSDEDPHSSFYRDLIQKVFNLPPHDIKAATDKEKRLSELATETATVYLYLDNQLDRDYLHTIFKPYLRHKKYSEYLEKQAAEIGHAAALIEETQGNYPLIVICSDHGHTILPNDAKIIDTGTGKDSKTRSVFLKKMAAEKLSSQNIWILQKDLFGLNDDMAMPTGYGCFDKRPKGATHGGATPQELMVPWIVLAHQNFIKTAPMEKLSFIIEGEIHRRRPENNINIVISNPNAYSVTIYKCDFDLVKLEEALPLTLPKSGVKKIPASIDASGIGENVVDIAGKCYVQGPTEEESWDFKLSVQTTGAMSTEFDDEFEI